MHKHPKQGQPMLQGPRAVGGSVPCSRVSPQSWYWRWREYSLFTPPTDNSCWSRDSNPQPRVTSPMLYPLAKTAPISVCVHAYIQYVSLTMVKGINCKMLPRLPCSEHSTHSSIKLCTNCVWGPAVLDPKERKSTGTDLLERKKDKNLLWLKRHDS